MVNSSAGWRLFPLPLPSGAITFLSQEGHVPLGVTSVFKAERWKGERLVPTLSVSFQQVGKCFAGQPLLNKSNFLCLIDEKGVIRPLPRRRSEKKHKFLYLLPLLEGQEFFFFFATAP